MQEGIGAFFRQYFRCKPFHESELQRKPPAVQGRAGREEPPERPPDPWESLHAPFQVVVRWSPSRRRRRLAGRCGGLPNDFRRDGTGGDPRGSANPGPVETLPGTPDSSGLRAWPAPGRVADRTEGVQFPGPSCTPGGRLLRKGSASRGLRPGGWRPGARRSELSRRPSATESFAPPQGRL